MKKEICSYCKRTFIWNEKQNPNRIRKFCSRECNGRFQVGLKFSDATKLKMSLTRTKEWAEGKRNGHSGWHHSNESKLKIGIANKGKTHIAWNKGLKLPQLSGEKSPVWKGEKCIKKQERNDSAYSNWVRQVKKRDNNQCVFKGQNCFGYNIVHHILSWTKFPELRYEIKNGITLCQYHHPRKRVDEQRLIPFFQTMVMSKELICK